MITDVKLEPIEHSKIRALVNIEIDGVIIVRGMKLVDGKNGMFLGMPARYNKETREWNDMVIFNEPLISEVKDRIFLEYEKNPPTFAKEEAKENPPEDVPF